MVEGDVAVAGVVNVWGYGEGLVGGAEATGDEAGLVGVALGVGVGDLAGESGGFAVDLVHAVFEAELGEAVAGGGEGVGGEEVGAGVEVAALDVADEVGLCEYEDVNAALEVVGVVGEAVAAVVSLAESLGLEHDSPGAVHDHDAAFEDALDVGGAVGDGMDGGGGGCCHGDLILCSCGRVL